MTLIPGVNTGRIEFWPEHQVATMVVLVKKHDIFCCPRDAFLFARFLP
jgi:hypothetical protein